MAFEPYWVALSVAPILIRWLGIHAETARAKRKNGVVAFPASGLTLLCFISILLAISVVIGGWRQGAGSLTIAIGIVWGYPYSGCGPPQLFSMITGSQQNTFGGRLERFPIQRLNMSLEPLTEAQSCLGKAK